MSDKIEVLHNQERREITLRCDLDDDRHVLMRANDWEVAAAPAEFAAWAVLAVLAATKDQELPSSTKLSDDGFVPVLLWRP